jgi:hypothetical protein
MEQSELIPFAWWAILSSGSTGVQLLTMSPADQQWFADSAAKLAVVCARSMAAELALQEKAS